MYNTDSSSRYYACDQVWLLLLTAAEPEIQQQVSRVHFIQPILFWYFSPLHSDLYDIPSFLYAQRLIIMILLSPKMHPQESVPIGNDA